MVEARKGVHLFGALALHYVSLRRPSESQFEAGGPIELWAIRLDLRQVIQLAVIRFSFNKLFISVSRQERLDLPCASRRSLSL